MRDVSIIGIGQTPVGEHWSRSLRHLAYDALAAAMRDADVKRIDALYVGNMLSGAVFAEIVFARPASGAICGLVELVVG